MNPHTIQLLKVARRPDVLFCLLFSFGFPAVIALLVAGESDIISLGGIDGEKMPGIGFAGGLLGLFKAMLIPYVFMMVIVPSLFAGEISSGLDRTYSSLTSGRTVYLLSKLLSAFTISAASTAIVLLSSVLAWIPLAFISPSFSQSFLSQSTTINEQTCLSFLLCFLEQLFIVATFIAISLSFKKTPLSMMGCFLFIALMKVGESIDSVSRFIPSYMGSGVHLYNLSGQELFLTAGTDALFFIASTAALCGVSILAYRRMVL